MTLNDILRRAQGGQAVVNLAGRHGLTPEQAEAATSAMLPAFAVAFDRLRSRPEAFGALLTEVAGGGHEASFARGLGDAPADSAAARVFGPPEDVAKVVDQVAAASGVAPATIAAMLPEVASILLGGLSQAMADQGLSGALGDLAAAASAPGGLAAALGHADDSGGLLKTLGSIFGGSHRPASPEQAALVASVAALGAMFVAGVQASQASQASLAAIAQTLNPPPSI
ncbi:hypothetical protein DFR50_10765 [Roseiarcus fermentans]|uniref:DUF937 domain-containing protein n=1 Tax=Roseiarcus fermentans TaxID=1473586 RepID=A0A366FQ00_9HYPH|nr:DUF937 domain-containing protein [Roseiarcus fermentans]RBP15795.1 hypothetical protein DFR50_10765 [Roseiarcus fermentans]